MANKQAQPRISFASMSSQDWQHLLAGGNTAKPLYEFDENGDVTYHEENLQYYSPNVILTNPFTGRDETATAIVDYVKNQDEHKKTVEQTYNSLLKYNHDYNTDALALQAIKSPVTFASEAIVTAGETVGNIANAVHSVGRLVHETNWSAIAKAAPESAKKEMEDILTQMGDEEALFYVKNHDFDSDLTISDEAKKLFKSYRTLLQSRDNDNFWGQVLDQTWAGTRAQADKALNKQSGGNKYQNINKFAQFAGSVAGSLGVFKGAGWAAKAITANKVGAALTKTFGVTGQSAAVYGTAFFNQYDSLRRQALMAGKSYDEANQMAFLGAAFEALVEGWGIGHYGRLEAKKSLLNVIKADMYPEALEEMVQTGGENIFTSIYGVNTNTFRDAVEQIIISGLGGALGGGAVGGAEYVFGTQAATRMQAAQEMKATKEQAAYDKAKSKNQDWLLKQQEKANKALEQQQGGTTTQAAQSSQEVAEMAQQKAFPYNEQRLLLEHDKEYAAEMKAAKEEFKQTMKEVMTEKLKKANPNITQEQIDNAAALLYRVSAHLETNDEYGAAIAGWAEDIVKWSNERAPQYAQNLKEIDQRFGIETLGLTPQDVADINSNNRITRQNAQWKMVKLSIKSELQHAGVSEQYAGKLGDAFEAVFSTTALMSNLSPVDLYRKLSPKIIGLSRASVNKQSIAGYQGVLDNLPMSVQTDGRRQRVEAENILNDLSSEDNSQEANTSKEVAINELFRGMDSKTGINEKDILQAVESRARMEQRLAEEMGNTLGHEITFNDFRVMALVRARGANQSQINEAFALGEKLDAEQEYQDALNKLYPKLTTQEVKEAERILAKANEERPSTAQQGLFEKENPETVQSQTGNDLQQEGNVGGTIVLGSDVSGDVAAEEFFHAVSNLMEEAAKIEAIKDSEKSLFAAYDIYSMGLLPNTKPIAKLFDDITRPLNGIELTDRQKHETLATAFVNYVKLETMPKVQKDALNMHNGEINDLVATADDSKYQDLTPAQKQALGERFMNLMKPEATGELIAMGNQIANAGADFNVEQAKELAIQALGKYQIYNDAQWAYLFSEMDTMSPEQQLDLVQSFGTAMVQQGYDSLVANTYNVEYDEESRQVLRRKAYAEQSLLSDEQTPAIYFHSETVKPNTSISAYKTPESWVKKTWKWAKETFDMSPLWSDYVETLSHAAFKADPVLGSVLRRAMWRYGERQIKLQKLSARISQLAEQHKLDLMEGDKRPAFVENFKNVLLAGNPGARQRAKSWMVEQFAGTGAMEEVGQIMDEIYAKLDQCRDELVKRGVPVGFIAEYWPRYVADRQGFAEYFGHNAPITQTEGRIKELVDTLKGKFPKASLDEINRMAIDSINRQWHKYEMGEDVTSLHERGNYFTTDTSTFYEDPFETLARYFENVNRTLLMRELTGRVMESEEDEGYSLGFNKALVIYKKDPSEMNRIKFTENETGQLGKAFAAALTKRNPNWEALDNFAKKMKMYVNKVGNEESAFVKFWQRTNAMLLGNPISTLSQFNELPLIIKAWGLDITNEALKEAVDEILNEAKKDPDSPDLENVNVQALQELIRYKDNDMLAKLTEMAHTVSGFSGMDILLKNTEIKACLKGARKILKSGDVNDVKFKRLMRLFDNTFPELIYSDKERMDVIEQLKAGELTDNVKFFAFNYLSNVQPINMAEVPTGFLTSRAAGKLIYQYHTTALRQLEYVADDVKWSFENLPLKDAIKNLLSYFAFFMAIGVPVEVLQNLLRGRKTNLAEAAVYSPFQLLSINEYTIASIRKKGLFSGIIDELSPTFRVGDDVTKDVIRVLTMKDYQGNAIKDLPIAGPFVYYWLLGGREYAKRQGVAIGQDVEEDKRRANAIKAITR